MKKMLLLLCYVLLMPGVAWADVVPPPPKCVAGANGATGHGGPYCSPNGPCTTDAECNGGTCADVSLCIEKKRICGGRPAPDGGQNCADIEDVKQACGAGGACPANTACDTSKRCFPKGTQPPPLPADGGGGTTDKTGGSSNDKTGTDSGLGVTSVCGCSTGALPFSSLLILLFAGLFVFPSRRQKAKSHD